MEKYKVKRTVIFDALTYVKPSTTIYLDIENSHVEFYSLWYMSTTREEIEHYVIDNWYRFIELPNYKELKFHDTVNSFIKSLNNKEVEDKVNKINASEKYWYREFSDILTEYKLWDQYIEFRDKILVTYIDYVGLKYKDKMEIID